MIDNFYIQICQEVDFCRKRGVDAVTGGGAVRYKKCRFVGRAKTSKAAPNCLIYGLNPTP